MTLARTAHEGKSNYFLSHVDTMRTKLGFYYKLCNTWHMILNHAIHISHGWHVFTCSLRPKNSVLGSMPLYRKILSSKACQKACLKTELIALNDINNLEQQVKCLNKQIKRSESNSLLRCRKGVSLGLWLINTMSCSKQSCSLQSNIVFGWWCFTP